MKRSLNSRRTPSNLPALLHQRLSTYALAAGAAGVSLLALGQSSEAEVVYTPANDLIGRDGSYNLDLNHDGIVDYIITERAGKDRSFGTVQLVSATARLGNKVNCPSAYCISGLTYAAALSRGIRVPSQLLGWLGQGVPMALREQFKTGRSVYYAFAWDNVSDRYLGLRFQINGETHYGWARLTVKFHHGLPKDRTWDAHLTGYAYETIPDKAIRAGQTEGAADDATARPHSTSPSGATLTAFARKPVSRPAQFAALGTLALGADGFPLWRREESESDGKSRDN